MPNGIKKPIESDGGSVFKTQGVSSVDDVSSKSVFSISKKYKNVFTESGYTPKIKFDKDGKVIFETFIGSSLPSFMMKKVNNNKNVEDILKRNMGIDRYQIDNPYSLARTDVFNDIAAMIFRWSSEIQKYDKEFNRIKKQYELGLSTSEPDECEGGKYAESKKMFALVNKVLQKLDITDFNITISSREVDISKVVDKIVKETLKDKGVVKQFVEEFGAKSKEELDNIIKEIKNGVGSRNFIRFIIKEGLTFIMNEIGIRNTYMDSDNGTYMSAIKYGSGFSYLEKRNGKFKFKSLKIGQCIFDEKVTSLRNASSNLNVRKGMIVFDYPSLESAITDFPDAKEILTEYCNWGMLPFNNLNKTSKDWATSNEQRAGQIAMYYDIDNKICIYIAGCDASIIKDESGIEYPYILNKEPYAPVFMTYIFDNEDWIYKKGVGHYASQLNNIDSILRNITINRFIQDNTPIDIISIADGYEAEMKNKIRKAQDDAIKKGRGVVINNISDNGDGQFMGVSPLSTGSQWGMEKKQMLAQDIDTDIVNMGINMAEINDNPYKTAEAVQNEASLVNAIIEKMESVNEQEFKFLIQVILEEMKTLDESLSIPTDKFNVANKSVRFIMQPTLKIFKMIMDELKVIITTQFSNGVKPHNVQRARMLMNNLQFIPFGSKASLKVISEALKLSNIDISEDELMPPPPPPQPVPQGQGQQQQVM